MKFHMLSIVVGGSACTAKCPFCVSEEAPCEENRVGLNEPETTMFVLRKLKKAIVLAENSGVSTVMLTSRGETTLYPHEITLYLKELQGSRIPFIELQTNGLIMAQQWNKYSGLLENWTKMGLTTVNISTVSHKPEINKGVYTPNSDYIKLPKLIEYLHKLGLTVRLTCVMCKDWMDTPEKVNGYLEFAAENNVEQVTMRPLNDEYRCESAQNWINQNKIPSIELLSIWNWLNKNGTALLEIPRVGTVFDLNGQNVMFSKPLTEFTRDTDPENGRNLIVFTDGYGRVAYEWEIGGGTLL